MFALVNEYKLTNIYAYDGQLVTNDGINSVNGSDFYFINIGVAGSEQFNDSEYYIEFLGWSPHFFSFINLDVSDNILPVLK